MVSNSGLAKVRVTGITPDGLPFSRDMAIRATVNAHTGNVEVFPPMVWEYLGLFEGITGPITDGNFEVVEFPL